ncbi:MAG: diaminohydroxyphosphoribosylaminopyrimidine deaminase [Tenuifilum sp.]|uniref:bifunctional diaminohydroxyphosphoribosylaminopyrimidine deaminase/5-amino-6-(5-phosphoribosylamino)uracil reductase RibD n=1 Tax=Tenuifilum sp. TaxID=2760880 RepID=UPI0024AB07C6|nr:bifunctional diaminohydroxyphosphoribosylaminopyrimidine deaminase/5-amino-6-(5-phosphoribosylamino)uracil reductase RibD [Tenuifilum sp.]MDI3527684.1 diaminohydroxyphosphoribosylaminopyrimidine deaminase [Tenuifilum sp.]
MDNAEVHRKYMARCLELALGGQGNVAPNPLVGAVIVHNGKIIGEGFHAVYGQAHAEVNAINSVQNKELLKESTLYVSLEPCSHYGKTPPCTERIIEHEIPRVVIATTDPNPKVAGRGIEVLRNSGKEVITGVLEDEAKELNRRFITFHTKKRPYVILKWAQTMDGFIDKIREADEPVGSNWITNELARSLVHRWRSEEQAIIVGTNTVEKDNPRLNVRNWSGRPPVRVVIDRKLRLPLNSNVFDGSQPTLLITGNNSSSQARKHEFTGIENLEIITIDFAKGIENQILKELAERDIISVIIEGGGMVLSSFIKKNLWDEARMFVGNKFFGDGIKAPTLSGKLISYDEIGDSKLFVYRRSRQG